MRGETVAQGIKRRTAEKAEAARKRRLRIAIDVAIWSGAIGSTMMMMGIGAFLAAGHGGGGR